MRECRISFGAVSGGMDSGRSALLKIHKAKALVLYN